MTDNHLRLAGLLADTSPIPLTVDVDLLSDVDVPRHDGEPLDAYTGRRLRESSTERPTRRRQCSIGYHGECSDRDGTDGCGCDCHTLLRRLYTDHPILEALRTVRAAVSWDSSGEALHAGWDLYQTLTEAGLHAELVDGPERPETYHPDGPDEIGDLCDRLYGARDADGCEYVALLMAGLAVHHIRLTRTSSPVPTANPD